MNAKFQQRMPDDLHERLKKEADRRGLSVNSFINNLACETLDDLEIHQLKQELEQYRQKDKKNKK